MNDETKFHLRCLAREDGHQCLLEINHTGPHVVTVEPPHIINDGRDSFPAPVKRLHVQYIEKPNGKIVLVCTPERADIITRAGLGMLCPAIDHTKAMQYTLWVAVDLFDFDGVVTWLESLA